MDIPFAPMKILARLFALVISLGLSAQAFAAATILPPAVTCFTANAPSSGGTLGPIFSLGSISGGSSYVNGTYTNVPLTGGSGFGAQATIVVSGNAVSSVSISKTGSHYATGDSLSAATSTIGGGSGSGFSVPVNIVSTTGTGQIGLLGTIVGGSGGANGTYGGVPLTGGSGSGASATFTVSGGAVTAVAIQNPGKQYVVGDTLSAASGNIGGVSGFSVQISSLTINNSLAGGQVYFYYPGTNSFKPTWFNAAATSQYQNSNPVTLDLNGCAVIFGTGTYREILQDANGDTIWDQLTTDTSANNSTYWAGLATGTPNAITVTDPGFNGTDGSIIQFIPLYSNTSSATLDPSGYGVYPIVKDTANGAVALTGEEIIANSPSNVVSVLFSATQQNFHILNLINQAQVAAPTPTPGGYLNLVGVANGGPIQGSNDITAATTVYYSPYRGNQVPIWNGTSFTTFTFSELQLALSASAQSASTIYDVCIFNNAGSPAMVFGPAWSDSTAGAGSRGTGAGSAQLIYQSGILVNAVQIQANNGSNVYTIPALQCTYVGSVFIDPTAGEVSNYRTWGQSRRWDVWNDYWRVPICMQVGDSTASWSSSDAAIRPSNDNTANSLTAFTGLAEEIINNVFTQRIDSAAGTNDTVIGIGWNSTTAFSGTQGFTTLPNVGSSIYSSYAAAPSLGTNVVTSLEDSGTNSGELWGTQAFMLLRTCYNG
jgi:hypothetical protein